MQQLTNSKVNNEKAAYIGKQIEWYAYEVKTRRMSAEAAKEMASNVADRIANEWMLEGRKLDIDAGNWCGAGRGCIGEGGVPRALKKLL